MTGGIVKRLLCNAVTNALKICRQPSGKPCELALDIETGRAALLIDQPGQRILQTELIELRWTQLQGKIAQLVERGVGNAQTLGKQLFLIVVGTLRETMQSNFESRQRLADIVVQFARNAAPFLFLNAENTFRQDLQTLVGVTQCMMRQHPVCHILVRYNRPLSTFFERHGARDEPARAARHRDLVLHRYKAGLPINNRLHTAQSAFSLTIAGVHRLTQ